ncbi:MAG: sensor histidine kinase, partial [Lentisphaerota bacterium]
VKDTGCGISEGDQRHIFERFYRCDSSRSKPGNGLGLSLAKSIIKAHNGSITVESSLNSGSEFRIILPYAS